VSATKLILVAGDCAVRSNRSHERTLALILEPFSKDSRRD
jgi:hypothetical protein